MIIRNSSPGATNLVNPLTCKSLPVPQQCVIKPFNNTPLYIAGVAHVLMGCWRTLTKIRKISLDNETKNHTILEM